MTAILILTNTTLGISLWFFNNEAPIEYIFCDAVVSDSVVLGTSSGLRLDSSSSLVIQQNFTTFSSSLIDINLMGGNSSANLQPALDVRGCVSLNGSLLVTDPSTRTDPYEVIVLRYACREGAFNDIEVNFSNTDCKPMAKEEYRATVLAIVVEFEGCLAGSPFLTAGLSLQIIVFLWSSLI
jgi:hypothetical protein